MKQSHLLSFVLTLLAIPAIALGQLPRTLSYQGVLSDTLGNPKPDGTYSFAFRLYESSSGGSAIWTEQKVLQLKRGLFHTILGDQVVMGNAIVFDRPYWLGIQMASDPEMIPRVALSSVGYSRRAERAEKADTATYALSAPSQAFVDSARVASTIPDGVVTTNKIGNNAVTSGKIASAQVVKSINSLKDDVTLSAGSNVTITPSGNTLTIAASGGGGGNVNGTGATSQVPFWTGASSISGDNGLVWDNTNKRLGLGVSNPLDALQVNATAGNAVFGNSLSTTGTSAGVYGVSASTFGNGVSGFASSASGITHGVLGTSLSSSGIGVAALASSTTGLNYGVFAQSASSDGRGVYGFAASTTGTTYGVVGQTNSPNGQGVRGLGQQTGVYGNASSTTGDASGVYGVSASGTGEGVRGLGYTGVLGESSPITGVAAGVIGRSSSSAGRGVYGEASALTGFTEGVSGFCSSSNGKAVYGIVSATSGTTYGVDGISASSSGTGVRGRATSATGTTYGVFGQSNSSSGYGVRGIASSLSGVNTGVQGLTPSTDGIAVEGWASATTGSSLGVYGHSDSPAGRGVHGYAPTGGAAMFCIGAFYQTDGVFEAHPTSTIWTTNKPATVKINNGTKIKLFAEEAAEIYFNDYGEGHLANGRTHIDLDPRFAQTVTIDASHPMKVFVQLEDDCKGVFVSNKTSSGFDVVELQGGNSKAKFSYRIVCKRKYYEDERLATEEEDIGFNTRMHEQAWPEVIAVQQTELAREKSRSEQLRKQMENDRKEQERRQADEQQRINRDWR